ncbi:hypothetical protein HPB48_019245 [Haemaphysalis longicornis]|uniref:Uncharacterized protein n=1 Tax=Haemaphysalis longicornis TaxID=44386 RepID=A0A9J6GQM7_HAELO|nr:hypothetical protein HPB48_019245 [Haemaphysalis longicornis]
MPGGFICAIRSELWLPSLNGYVPASGQSSCRPAPMLVLTLELLVWSVLDASGQDALGVARITSEAPYLRDGAINLSCSITYGHAAHTAWNINGRPPDDSAFESIFTSRPGKNLWLRAHGLMLNRLDRFPSASGRYELRCLAVADGKFSLDSVFVGSLFSDVCRGPEPCAGRGAVCRRGRCRCEGAMPVRLTSRHTTCRHAAMLGWPCNFDEQCIPKGAYCGPQGTCDCRPPLQAVALSCVAPNASQCAPCGQQQSTHTPAVAQPTAQLQRSQEGPVSAAGDRVPYSTLLLPPLLLLHVLRRRP